MGDGKNVKLGQDRIIQQIARGFGPVIGEALADPMVSDILLNEDGRVWVERFGQEMKVDGEADAGQVVSAVNALATYHGVVCHRNAPIMSCELPECGSRIEVNVPPVVSAVTLSIRKKASKVFLLNEYVENGVMSAAQQERIIEGVGKKENFLVTGSTGSGKTTLANAVIAEIVEQDANQRMFVLEDSVEIQCAAENKSCKRTAESADTRDLLRSAMRQRPDRIIIGEVRDAVAWDLLKAWNTGHPGGICTIHAEADPHVTGKYDAALKRIEQLCAEHPNCPKNFSVLREIISDTIGLIVYIGRDAKTFQRKVAEIVEVSRGENGYHLSPLGAQASA